MIQLLFLKVIYRVFLHWVFLGSKRTVIYLIQVGILVLLSCSAFVSGLRVGRDHCFLLSVALRFLSDFCNFDDSLK